MSKQSHGHSPPLPEPAYGSQSNLRISLDLGLEAFLGALVEGDHWLLLMDLDGSLLPFKKMRVRSSELRETTIPGERLLIIENESCQHQLPAIPRTIAVLGAGFDLSWTEADWLSTKQVAYWGDIDTWGLQLLARARKAIRRLDPLMMTCEIFERFADLAVAEPVVAGTEVPTDLSESEQRLYRQLLNETSRTIGARVPSRRTEQGNHSKLGKYLIADKGKPFWCRGFKD